MKSLLLFGGSFDPVHNGHLAIANEALKHLPSQTQLLFVPSFASPGKPSTIADPEMRVFFLSLATVETKFRVSKIEIVRRGTSYTVDTLHCYRAEFPNAKLFWLLGADAYLHFAKWREPDEIRRLATLVVAARPGYAITQQDPNDILLVAPDSPWSSTQIRQQLALGQIPVGALPKYLEQHLKNLLLKGQNPYASL
jgi:nicotinate-nucleotide adenylyltransferase